MNKEAILSRVRTTWDSEAAYGMTTDRGNINARVGQVIDSDVRRDADYILKV